LLGFDAGEGGSGGGYVTFWIAHLLTNSTAHFLNRTVNSLLQWHFCF
jgi:hypothetical protein